MHRTSGLVCEAILSVGVCGLVWFMHAHSRAIDIRDIPELKALADLTPAEIQTLDFRADNVDFGFKSVRLPPQFHAEIIRAIQQSIPRAIDSKSVDAYPACLIFGTLAIAAPGRTVQIEVMGCGFGCECRIEQRARFVWWPSTYPREKLADVANQSHAASSPAAGGAGAGP